MGGSTSYNVVLQDLGCSIWTVIQPGQQLRSGSGIRLVTSLDQPEIELYLRFNYKRVYELHKLYNRRIIYRIFP